MTRSDSTVFVTRLDQVMTLTRKNFRWLWLDSDSTKMTRTHHCWWPRQQPLTDASTGVDHTRASPDDANQFGAHGSCSARGFHWETGRRMCDAFSIRGKKLDPERHAPCVSTCGERSKRFIEDDEPCASLFRIEVSRTLAFPKKDCSCCACACGKRPKRFIEDMNFETRLRCGTCPSSSITLKFSATITHTPGILTSGDFYPGSSGGHVIPRWKSPDVMVSVSSGWKSSQTMVNISSGENHPTLWLEWVFCFPVDALTL